MEREVFWQAIRTRDARFDGMFVFGVKTTGIFCRPSCSAKSAKRENITFFDGIESAQREGFRACLRCKPTHGAVTDPKIETVLRACELMRTDVIPSLAELGSKLELSPSHLQKIFKEIIGVSPKKYGEMRRLERFKAEIKDGSDVVTAMYDAGFGSSSRLYEKAAENLGMTPAVYKKGGTGMDINYIITDCQLGKMLVARTTKGICSVTFGESKSELAQNLAAEFPNAMLAENDFELQPSVNAITSYLSGKTKRFDLPLDIQATAFQMQVLDFLRKIPYGETRSYTEVAAGLGDRKKVRAVAQACAKNRVAVVIPCHRVIASNGKLSGYRWGIERKQWLLDAEREK